MQIISGGQTGVDRGALDAALDAHFLAGGWCPADRSAEDGPVPARYPLKSLERGGYPQRTLRNVLDSDATAILAPGPLTGGTRLTFKRCREHRKPVQVLDALQLTTLQAAAELARFVTEHQVCILNLAGPRASGWPAGQEYARATVAGLLVLAQGGDPTQDPR